MAIKEGPAITAVHKEAIDRVLSANGDPYLILDVVTGTTDLHLLKAAKRRAMLDLHPDKNGLASAGSAFQQVIRAYEVLIRTSSPADSSSTSSWTADEGPQPPDRPAQAHSTEDARTEEERRWEDEWRSKRQQAQAQRRERDQQRQQAEAEAEARRTEQRQQQPQHRQQHQPQKGSCAPIPQQHQQPRGDPSQRRGAGTAAAAAAAAAATVDEEDRRKAHQRARKRKQERERKARRRQEREEAEAEGRGERGSPGAECPLQSQPPVEEQAPAHAEEDDDHRVRNWVASLPREFDYQHNQGDGEMDVGQHDEHILSDDRLGDDDDAGDDGSSSFTPVFSSCDPDEPDSETQTDASSALDPHFLHSTSKSRSEVDNGQDGIKVTDNRADAEVSPQKVLDAAILSHTFTVWFKARMATIQRVFRAKGDPYLVLGIPHNTTDHALIKLAKRQGALLLHPDKNHHPGASDAMVLFNAAFEKLMALPKGKLWVDPRQTAKEEQQRRQREKQSQRDKEKAQAERKRQAEGQQAEAMQLEREKVAQTQCADGTDVPAAACEGHSANEAQMRQGEEYALKVQQAQQEWLKQEYLRQIWARQQAFEEHWRAEGEARKRRDRWLKTMALAVGGSGGAILTATAIVSITSTKVTSGTKGTISLLASGGYAVSSMLRTLSLGTVEAARNAIQPSGRVGSLIAAGTAGVMVAAFGRHVARNASTLFRSSVQRWRTWVTAVADYIP
ncbi:subfamily C member 14 [Tilletia horrida]|nr:subfamily C member 14 [Tilletia horrida]